MAGGHTLIVEHDAAGTAELLSEIDGREFALLSEVAIGSATRREVLVSTRQISLVRPLTEGSTQGSGFRPKR